MSILRDHDLSASLIEWRRATENLLVPRQASKESSSSSRLCRGMNENHVVNVITRSFSTIQRLSKTRYKQQCSSSTTAIEWACHHYFDRPSSRPTRRFIYKPSSQKVISHQDGQEHQRARSTNESRRIAQAQTINATSCRETTMTTLLPFKRRPSSANKRKCRAIVNVSHL